MTAPAPLRNPDETVACAYCQATGPAAHFELMGPPEVRQNWACRQQNLCALRCVLPITPGRDNGELVHAILQLVRELAQVGMTDLAERNAKPLWLYGDYRGMLSDTDLARLHLVLPAAAAWLQAPPGRGDLIQQAHADLGCKRCGAIGREDCVTSGGNEVPRRFGSWGPRWHAGRTL